MTIALFVLALCFVICAAISVGGAVAEEDDPMVIGGACAIVFGVAAAILNIIQFAS
jgi:hypothetical protein